MSCSNENCDHLDCDYYNHRCYTTTTSNSINSIKMQVGSIFLHTERDNSGEKLLRQFRAERTRAFSKQGTNHKLDRKAFNLHYSLFVFSYPHTLSAFCCVQPPPPLSISKPNARTFSWFCWIDKDLDRKLSHFLLLWSAWCLRSGSSYNCGNKIIEIIHIGCRTSGLVLLCIPFRNLPVSYSAPIPTSFWLIYVCQMFAGGLLPYLSLFSSLCC